MIMMNVTTSVGYVVGEGIPLSTNESCHDFKLLHIRMKRSKYDNNITTKEEKKEQKCKR